jgi:uncharacterized cupin superfamily protein
MSSIIQRQATEEEQHRSRQWELWESGDTDHFQHDYDRDVQFVVQSGAAVIHSADHPPVAIAAGDHVTVRKGVQGRWMISSPIVNRYQYL